MLSDDSQAEQQVNSQKLYQQMVQSQVMQMPQQSKWGIVQKDKKKKKHSNQKKKLKRVLYSKEFETDAAADDEDDSDSSELEIVKKRSHKEKAKGMTSYGAIMQN